jgi:hypothetical protein
MEKKNLKLKNNFTQLISQVSKLYKDVSASENEAYNLGKKDAYEEIINWFITSHNGDLKYISASAFFNMIQEKLTKAKAGLKEDEGNDGLNLAEIKVSDNRKRNRPTTDMEIEDPSFNLASPEYTGSNTNSVNTTTGMNLTGSNISMNGFLPKGRIKKFK